MSDPGCFIMLFQVFLETVVYLIGLAFEKPIEVEVVQSLARMRLTKESFHNRVLGQFWHE